MYYVLVKAGVPVDVCVQMAMAKQRARELETPGSPVQIVPVVPTLPEIVADGAARFDSRPIYRASIEARAELAKEKAPEVSPESPIGCSITLPGGRCSVH